MVKVNRKLDFSSFNAKEKTKKSFKTRNVDKKLNLLSFTKEVNINDVTIEYLCPYKCSNYKCSNKIFKNPEYVKKHLLNFHKIPRKLQKPRFAPIRRITYKS